MMRFLLPALLLLLAGCTSLRNPDLARDYYETRYRAAQAVDGNAAAFDRLAELQKSWAALGHQDWQYRLCVWDRANRDRAAQLAAESLRVLDAREGVLAQGELVGVMVNALKDLEAEYDEINNMLVEGDATVADVNLASEQKYLARRMAHNLALMSLANMDGAVEAADVFGRDVHRFQHLLEVEVNGDDELGIEPPATPELEDSLAQVEDLFTGYIADSAGDVLENVVARYDAWLAMADMAAHGGAAEATAVAQKPAAIPTDDDAASGEQAADDAGAEGEESVVGDDGSPVGAGADAGMEEAAGDDAPAEESSTGDMAAEEPMADEADDDEVIGDGTVGDEPVDDEAGAAP